MRFVLYMVALQARIRALATFTSDTPWPSAGMMLLLEQWIAVPARVGRKYASSVEVTVYSHFALPIYWHGYGARVHFQHQKAMLAHCQ